MSTNDNRIQELRHLLNEYKIEKNIIEKNLKKEKEELDEKIVNIIKDRNAVFQLAKERQKGFPWLAEAYDEYFRLQEIVLRNYLIAKEHPAQRASEIVKEQSELRRKAEKDKKAFEYLVKYYESICPFLIDLKEEVDIPLDKLEEYEKYSEKEKEDAVTRFLTIDEYRKLPSAEKSQTALDRYIKRPKSNWEIGRMYERFIGYEYEESNFDVEFVGALKGYEDLGRDLICKAGNETLIIQCKMWAQFKTIYEKHIFQFFGTVFQYKDEHPDEKVKAVFYTTTKLSKLARHFGEELNIELKEDYKYDQSYPCIKCNISKVDGEKIYHLPFDQQYDKVKIEKEKGEFYCSNVAEAENLGFRRAFKYHGLKK
jgi:hypothetical protein